MKTKYPEFFLYDDDVTKELWDNSLIAFDASALLNLYQYSKDTLDDFLDAMKLYKNRIFIPNWVILEFLRRKDAIIDEQVELYNNLIDNLKDSLSALKTSKNHPFVSKDKLRKFERNINEMTKELEKNRDEYCINKTQKKDMILKELMMLFENRIGEPYTEKQLDEIMAEGDIRLSEKIPPGYCDYINKKELGNSTNRLTKSRRYGDLIIWRQILEIAKEKNKSVLFISDDTKKDWCYDKCYTRRELFKEFLKYTDGKFFRIIQSFKFLNHVDEESDRENGKKLTINESTINEVKEISEQNFEVPNYLDKIYKKFIKQNSDAIWMSNDIFKKNIDNFSINYDWFERNNEIIELQKKWFEQNRSIIDEIQENRDIIEFKKHMIENIKKNMDLNSNYTNDNSEDLKDKDEE
ncbi:PIN domain-containing protein [uncultured Sphaerochaeta sp.]|uniref:PIN domain-containing protein n=1 Tax=uncultured Sphaerochaeta sp. TaxID=886478 RepID=UPI002A0A7241|nr:PIN domain-containing protein [uncultured Sphaerochaeta sp.]